MLYFPLLQIVIESWGAVICTLFALIIFLGGGIEKTREKYLILMVMEIVILLFSDSMAIYFRGNLSTFGYYAVRIGNYLCFTVITIVEVTAGQLLKSHLTEYDCSVIKGWSKITYLLSAAAILFVTISQFNGYMYYFDEDNRYQRGPGIMVYTVLAFLIAALVLYVCLHNYSHTKSLQMNALLFIFLSGPISNILQMLFYGISLVYISLSVGMLGLLLAYHRENIQLLMDTKRKLLENKMKLMEQEKELADKRTKLMLSQIQPHFIFNTLAAISSLCVFDAAAAKTTTDNFATYLRCNLDSIGDNNLIPFSQELAHVKAYLSIEKVRFEDELRVVYDIQEEHFMIPPLTLQPIVENAVRHGIRHRENGGTVAIHTSMTQQAIRIIVQDNGVGFDKDAILKDDKSHVGIENVSERIRVLCNGTIDIRSEIGNGTLVTITLPI